MSHLGVRAIQKLLTQRRNMLLQKPRTESIKARMARERKRKETKLFNIVYKREMQRWNRLLSNKTPTGAKFLQLLSTTRTRLCLRDCFEFSLEGRFSKSYDSGYQARRTYVDAERVFKWLAGEAYHAEGHGNARLALIRGLLPAFLRAVLGAFKRPNQKRLRKGGSLFLVPIFTWARRRKIPSFRTEWEE